jgi:hypothetical protein
MNNETDFRAEFIRFLKYHGYPENGIFCDVTIGKTHVDYLITVQNSNERVAIMTVQGVNDNPAQIRKQLEFCRQKMDELDYQVYLLTPTTKVQSKYPFALHYLDIENFQ